MNNILVMKIQNTNVHMTQNVCNNRPLEVHSRNLTKYGLIM